MTVWRQKTTNSPAQSHATGDKTQFAITLMQGLPLAQTVEHDHYTGKVIGLIPKEMHELETKKQSLNAMEVALDQASAKCINIKAY